MIVRFDNTSQNSAQYLGKLNGGFVKIWCFFPMWIGKTRSGLESPQPNPTAANFSVRDGMYIVNDASVRGSFTPIVLPWTGEVWVLNDGTQPNEAISNIAIVDLEAQCG